MDKNINTDLIFKLNSVIDDVFLALSMGHINQHSMVFMAACEAKKILKNDTYLQNQQQKVEDNSLHTRGSKTISFQKVDISEVNIKEPVMLTSCLKVVELIISKKYKFAEACNHVANEKGVNVPTVRQSCCRAIGLNAYQWNLFSKGSSEQKNNIISALKSRYPDFIHKINEIFKNN